jgi:hypothetical protein
VEVTALEINMLMKISDIYRRKELLSHGERLPFLRVIYRNHAHELAEIEVEKARQELAQLRADVLNTMADAKLSAAQAEETEQEAELTQQERETIQKIF